jgi:pimeloyl-ACP methyl ester carboxylesterase
MNRTLVEALLVVSLLFASACTSNQDESTTTSTAAASGGGTTTTSPVETTTTEQASAATYEPAPCEFNYGGDRAVECGWLEVPEDRDNPTEGTIRIHVAVFESDSSNAAPDPVVFLQGGPGGDTLELIPLVFEDRFAHLLADRDVILFDQRGTGYSEPSLACPELRELTFEYIEREDVSADEFLELQLETIEACRDRLIEEGADLDAYTSANNAADLADLRGALGIETWNLYGISYGTRLALTAMRDHPEGIRSVVLDSVYPPDVDIISDAPSNLDRSLRELFDGCAADPDCSAAYPDLEASFYQLLENLDAQPIRAEVTDAYTGDVYDAVFDDASLGSIVFQSLYSADAIEVLPLMIDNLPSGDTYELSVLASSFLVNGEFVSAGMQFSVQCNEEARFTSSEAVEAAIAEYPRLEPIFAASTNLGPAFLDACALWGAGQAPPLENEPVGSEIPTLVLAGEYDPITPPEWGIRAGETLAAATFVEFPGTGHGPTADRACPQRILRAFLNAPTEPVSTDCVAGMEPPAFLVPDAPIPDVTLEPFSEELLGTTWSGLVPAGWERQVPGVWARGMNAFDQTVVIQQFAAGTPSAALLRLIGPQFNLGDDPEPTDMYETSLGTWALYEGSLVGAPASLAVIEVSGGSLLAALMSPPADHDELRRTVLLPALDALATE